MPVCPRLPGTLLREDACDRERRSVGLQADCLLGVEVSQHWSGGELLLKLDECGACFVQERERTSELPLLAPHQKVTEGSREVRIPVDESLIEVGKTKEDLYFTVCLRLGLVVDGRDTILFHRHTIWGNHVPYESHAPRVELALLQFDVKLILLEALQDGPNVFHMLSVIV